MFLILSILRRAASPGPDTAPAARTSPGGDTKDAATALSLADLAMQRYADGDDAAFADVYRALAQRLRMFLRRMGCSVDVADDLTQETFLRMHHARGSFARGRQLAPWAYAIARNCFISHSRSGKSRLSHASVDAEQVELSAPGSSGEDETIARQSAEVVSRALLSMTPARREAFILIRYEGMSVAAAAQIVGISEGALKIRAFHAYEILRAALAGMDAAPALGARDGNHVSAET